MNSTVIGLGSIGSGIARSLLHAGHSVTGFDVRTEPLEVLRKLGGVAASDPAAAASKADAVFSVVVNASQTEELLFGSGGVAESMPAGSVFISCATVPPAFTRSIAPRLEKTGRHYLDCPTSGGPVRAADGTMTLLASGSAEAFERAGPALAAIAEKVFRLGDEPGIGSAMKAVNQLLAGVHIATACEALTFGIRLGLDPQQVYDVITQAAGNSWMFENRMPHVLEGDYSPRSAVSIFTKDLGLVLDAAREAEFPVPMAGNALQLFQMAAAAGMSGDDDSSVARIYARITGIELPAKADPGTRSP